MIETSEAPIVLVVDDEVFARRYFETILKQEGYQCVTANTVKECKDYLKEEFVPDLIILDVRLPDGNGLDLMGWIRKKEIEIPIIVITAFGSISDAVTAMKMGTFDFFTKPFEDNNKIKISIKNALGHSRLANENRRLRSQLISKGQLEDIIGKSIEMQRVFEMIQKAARVPSNILIEGKSGTGKELVARAVHSLSDRREKEFVAVNCAALPESLLESVLFGYEKGAFTGATKTTPGFFEEASGGTLFLDEIADAPLTVQVKILRAVQENTIYRIGRTRPITCNVRLIFATNKDLSDEVRKGRFREDLYYRINVIRIFLPPLENRTDDIPLLVNHFLSKYCKLTKIPIKVFTRDAIVQLLQRSWPGNVRELENFIERVVALHPSDVITAKDLSFLEEKTPLWGKSDIEDLKYKEAKEKFERIYLLTLLGKTDGDLQKAANVSGIHRATIYRKLNSLGISIPKSNE